MPDDQKTAGSGSKSPEQTQAQQSAKTPAEAEAKAGKVQLEHGEPSEATKAQQKEIVDPSSTVPAQMLVENQDPGVDPNQNEPSRGGADGGRTVKVNPLEPGETPDDAEDAPKGGTNAPA